MHEITRRRFLAATGAGAMALGTPNLIAPTAAAEPVLILGGGPAGAQAALSLAGKSLDQPIILVERDPARLLGNEAVPRPFSRPVTMAAYEKLASTGVQIVLDDVVAIDWRAGRTELISGRRIAFGRLVAAPGVSARGEGITGLDPVARQLWPAAWGSAREARRLAGQLAAMPDDSHVVFRLPPDAGGYSEIAVERILWIAKDLARTRPRARFTVLDPDHGSPARRLFAACRSAHGAAQVTWLDRTAGGQVLSVDAPRGILETSAGTLRADVVNFIPRQGAAGIVRLAGLTDDSGWCPCDEIGQSLLRPEALVLGDARKAAVRTVAAASRDGARSGHVL
ncbi:MAG: FAD-dependent oxidoreductase [Pseudomonadota bacterium]